ncbi:AMP-binding protein [Anabaena cylindrica UHCC 0172]|uniref:non-ribosomal peptide synthetase family protein n=1 Tax=Anabaena cylindrica TaxID=1165 RepID=UPI002B20B531|nr:AMP-binding protein [Anabaena cylindrica]MEA5552080.1 AMP-binding protein [Anabaena cylindrica UHCC 0172]
MSNIYRTIPKKLFNQKFVCNKLITPPEGFIRFELENIEQSIATRFEQHVKKYPHSIAVKTSTETLTYEQLNKNANRLANNILSQKGEKLEVIALLLEKGADFITSIFGGLKTGKIIVPLDSTFPIDRLAYILEDSQAVLIITNNQNLALAHELANNNCLILNIDENINDVVDENPNIHVLPETPAYIIYTSGSTGKPKGVVQSHINSLHYCMTDTNTLLISPEDRVVFLYSCSALGGLLCILYTLLNGASLYSYDVKKQGLNNLVNWLIEEEITIYHSFTTLLRHFVEVLTSRKQFPHIRLVKLGGEATLIRDVENYKQYFADDCILYASLGATETGTFRNFIVDKNTEIMGSNVPIGYGVEGMEVVLLDENGAEIENGSIGEIAVKSKYLALGYWQKPELTKAVFLSDLQNESERIYRTGDLGRIEADGCLVHMGRIDFQVKIRGFRIEVTEIEMELLNIDTLKEAVVIAREDIPGENRLVAYVVSKQKPAPTTKELRQYLQDKLPDYMMPSAFIFLDALPLTPNGKTDRRSLPDPELVKPEITATFVPACDDIEYQLTQIWEEFLGVKPIGTEDNFFELGGNSLLAVRLFAAIEDKFGKTLPLASLFPIGTVSAIAQIIRQEPILVNTLSAKSHQSSLVAIQPQGSKPPLFVIHSLGGEVLCYRHLAIHLGLEQPVYGLQPQGIDGKQPPFVRVEDMAAHYIQEIRTIQPQGPYFLGGYSFGGLVAYEMAQQLQKQGEKVSLVAMFDTCRPGYFQRLSVLKRIPLHLKNIIQGGHDYVLKKVIGWSRHTKYCIKKAYNYSLNVASHVLDISSKSPETDKYLQIIDANTQALEKYTFPAYVGRVALFRTKDENRTDKIGIKYDSQFGWGDIVTGELDIYHIPGSHLSLLNEPYVRVVAKQLKDCLEKTI